MGRGLLIRLHSGTSEVDVANLLDCSLKSPVRIELTGLPHQAGDLNCIHG